jgi:hypothetical protein
MPLLLWRGIAGVPNTCIIISGAIFEAAQKTKSDLKTVSMKNSASGEIRRSRSSTRGA